MYIERDSLKMAIEAEVFMTDSTKAAFRSIVRKEPAADVVEVVRCGRCKFCTIHKETPHCIRWQTQPEVALDDFCSYGERKENNHV